MVEIICGKIADNISISYKGSVKWTTGFPNRDPIPALQINIACKEYVVPTIVRAFIHALCQICQLTRCSNEERV